MDQSLQVDINDFVLAVYAFNRKAYIGKVIDIDTADSEVVGESLCHLWKQAQPIALMNAQP